ncbi:MAG: TlpA family protein disulfide reductase [Muribaculaceae bacterium]|nr:TlpA family protein disulfide reductase [Muribaculaceae bacterium]
MKINRFFALMAIPALFISAYAMVPKTEKQQKYLRITDVQRTDTSLRIGVRLQHLPNYWVMVDSTERLVDVLDTCRQYRILGAENFSLNKKVWMGPSGQHEGTLIFEKVPDDVKVVDMIESDVLDVKNNTLGIHLDEPESRIIPKLIEVSDILNDKKISSDSWSGLDPNRYSDLSFYDKDGKTLVKGKVMDYHPRSGVSTLSIRTKDDFTGNEKVNIGNINSDGSFEIEVPVTYPQFDYFELGDIHKNLFLIPGDTLSIVTTMLSGIDTSKGYVPEYFGYDGTPDDGIVINLLTDSLIYDRYPLASLYKNYTVKENDSMKSATYESNERLGLLLDSVISDLPLLLRDLPVSGFAKDMLSAVAIGKICEMMEDLELNFRFAKGPSFKKDENGTLAYQEGESLDILTYIAPRLKHKDLIYNNPLLICNGFILPNRWNFNSLFRDTGYAGIGFADLGGGAYIHNDDIMKPYKDTDSFLDSIGVGNCFVAQLVRTNSFINRLKTVETPSYEALERCNSLIAPLIRHNDIQKMNDIVMSEYCNMVKDVLIAENALADSDDSFIFLDGTPEGDVLEKIISPYRGNVLFLDFWGIGCGPCRAGMMRQKPLLEELADKPFKALYISNAEEGLEASKKWLRNEDIKGEHIFVTGDDWKRLCGLFTISGIPHGVLIGKDGKIIDPDYHIQKDEPKLKKALEK